MKIVILGSSGQLGSRLVLAAKAALPDAEIVACSRSERPGYFKFDPFTDDWQVLDKTDILINFIGAIEATPKYNLHDVHVGLATKIAENYKSIGGPRFIHISALGANPTHRTAFLRTKGIADEMLLKLPGCVILRPSIVYTPDTMLIRKIKMLLRLSRYMANTILLPVGLAATRIQPIMADDLNQVIIKLIDNQSFSGIIELAGPETYTVRQLVEAVALRTGQKVNVREISNWAGDILVGGVVTRLFPRLISKEQYILLKEALRLHDNQAEKILGKPLEVVMTALEKDDDLYRSKTTG